MTRRYDCEGELQYLYVAPPHRRNGIASELLTLLAGWFTERDASRVCVDVEPDNATARTFYACRGASDLNPHFLVWGDIGVLRGEK